MLRSLVPAGPLPCLRDLVLGAVAMAAVASGLPSAALADEAAGQSQMLRQLYLNGLARIAKGDTAAAVAPFQVTSEVAPELPQTHYSVALALVMSDFARRERALPAVDRALAGDPQHPLYNVVKVFADPKLSVSGADGALYLTPAGAERVQAAMPRIKDERTAQNGRYLVAVLAGIEPTDDGRYPYRLAGFDGMVGPRGTVRLPQWTEGQPLARLLTVTVPNAQFAAYEGRMVARLANGLDTLSNENQTLMRIKSRLQTVRGGSQVSG